MKALWDELNAKSNEMAKQVSQVWNEEWRNGWVDWLIKQTREAEER